MSSSFIALERIRKIKFLEFVVKLEDGYDLEFVVKLEDAYDLGKSMEEKSYSS